MTKLTPIARAIRTCLYDLMVAGHREARFARARELHEAARTQQYVEKFGTTEPVPAKPAEVS
jgi:hypothetical protein